MFFLCKLGKMLQLMIELLAETIECRRHKKDIFNMLKRTIGNNNSNNNYYCQLLLIKLSSKSKRILFLHNKNNLENLLPVVLPVLQEKPVFSG